MARALGVRAAKIVAIVCLGCLSLVARAASTATMVDYRGICDASAAVALDARMFVVANDEDSVLRVYRRGASGPPIATFDLASLLGLRKRQEADLEAAARIGARIFWITSHGAGSDGKPRPQRHRLFATDVKVDGDDVTFTPVGTPYTGLVRALSDAPALRALRLGSAAAIAPEAPGGLNIEGLGATPQGTLLIAFRNPVPQGKALLVPLLNPDEVVGGREARFGEPILLALGGNGIRSIDYDPASASYLVVAGPPGDDGAFGLYRWAGSSADTPMRLEGTDLAALHPEALVVYGDGALVLSDDGAVRIDGTRCKDARSSAKRFRAVELSRTTIESANRIP